MWDYPQTFKWNSAKMNPNHHQFNFGYPLPSFQEALKHHSPINRCQNKASGYNSLINQCQNKISGYDSPIDHCQNKASGYNSPYSLPQNKPLGHNSDIGFHPGPAPTLPPNSFQATMTSAVSSNHRNLAYLQQQAFNPAPPLKFPSSPTLQPVSQQASIFNDQAYKDQVLDKPAPQFSPFWCSLSSNSSSKSDSESDNTENSNKKSKKSKRKKKGKETIQKTKKTSFIDSCSNDQAVPNRN